MRNWLLMCALLVQPLNARESGTDFGYLAFYFKDIGERDGLFVAASEDGVRWEELTPADAPLLQPSVGAWKTFRDPSVLLDARGVFHLVWTAGNDGFGYSRSENLVDWTPPRLIRAYEGDGPSPWKNVWAPELFFDSEAEHYVVLWSATDAGVAHADESDMPWHRRKYDHRHYYQVTTDWEHFSAPRPFPGGVDRSHIDGMLFRFGKEYAFIFKDNKDGRSISIRRAPKFEGPYGDPLKFATSNTAIEGGFALRVGDRWRVYFDRFLEGGKFGYVETADLTRWDPPQSVQADFVMRHGSFVAVPRKKWSELVSALRR